MKNKLWIFVTIVTILSLFPNISFGQAPNLGATSSFALFTAAGGLTTDGATVVTGDVGSYDFTTVGFTGPGSVIGNIFPIANITVNQAFTDVSLAYADLFGRSGTVLGTPINLAGSTPGTLHPGTYGAIGAADITDNLILNGDGDAASIFIIKVNGALTLSAGKTITLTNSAKACNVYWQIVSFVDIGAGAAFVGTIVGNGAITLGEGASLNGRALTKSGAINLHNNVAGIPTDCSSAANITTAPVTQTVTSGGSASFTVVATGTGLTYQWRKGIVNLSNGGNISGATSATLTINPATITDVASNYNVVVSGTTGPAATSANVILVVNTAPQITTEPVNKSLCDGSSATFSVVATGTGLTYQWRKGTVNLTNGGNISGATSANLIINPIGTSDAATNYNVVVSGTVAPVATSVDANLTVNALPAAPAAIGGTTSVCIGLTTQLTDATAGGTWTSATPAIATISAGGLVTGITAGTSVITYTTAANVAGCTNSITQTVTVNALPAAPAAITGTPTVCVGSTTTLASTTASGVWSSATPGKATISAGGVVTGVSAGTSVITYTTAANGAGCTNSTTQTVTVNALPAAPAAITGTPTVCVGSTTTLADATASGVWTSATPGVATISTGGVVTGVSAGTSVISYTITSGGCSNAITQTVTVNALPVAPAAIGGTSSVCIGLTTQLTDVTVGGTWTSATPAVATISAGGLVSGVTAGTSIITYTSAANVAGCTNSITQTVTVNALPTVAAITGTPTVCIGSTTLLADATTGGAWTSATPAVATISANGLVTGVTAGTSVITYTTAANVAGCINSTTQTVTVNALPTVAAITGTPTVCIGSTTVLADVTTGGVWTSATPAIATINANGLVTGVAAGTSVINYTTAANVAGCTNSTTQTVTVNALPTVAAITGTPSVCIGSSTLLASTTASGAWSSATPAVATVSANGLVTGLTAGTSVITYTTAANVAGCTNALTQTVTVNALPSAPAAIGGSSTVCIGSTTLLTDATAGGTWISATPAVATISGIGLVTGITAGTSIITYTTAANTAGCTNSITKTITVDALPTVAVITGVATVCVGSTTTLANTTVDGVWSSAIHGVATISTGGVVTGVSAGTSVITYTTAANTAGCKNAVTQTVTVNALPTVAAITGTPNLCGIGSTTTLANTTVDGVWSSATPAVATISVGGVVTSVTTGTSVIKYTVTNTNGCINSQEVVVTVNQLPAAEAGVDKIICLGDSVQIGAVAVNGSTYSWSSVPVGFTSTLANPKAKPLSTTTYTVVETITESGCMATNSDTVKVNTAPNITVQPANLSICDGSPASFSVTANGTGLTYQWKEGTSNLVNGGNISGATTAMLTINPAHITDAAVNYNVVISGTCAPKETSINVTLVVLPNIVAEPNNQMSTIGGSTSFSVTAIGTDLTYQWRKGTVNLTNGGNISGATTATLTIYPVKSTDAAINYNVVVNGTCAANSKSRNASLWICECTTGTPSFKSGVISEVVSIYPDPFTSSIVIAINDESQINNCELKIYNVSGKAVINTNLSQQLTTLDTSNLPSGAYLYKVISNGKTIQSGKLVSQ